MTYGKDLYLSSKALSAPPSRTVASSGIVLAGVGPACQAWKQSGVAAGWAFVNWRARRTWRMVLDHHLFLGLHTTRTSSC